jgi:hypothetical protein
VQNNFAFILKRLGEFGKRVDSVLNKEFPKDKVRAGFDEAIGQPGQSLRCCRRLRGWNAK